MEQTEASEFLRELREQANRLPLTPGVYIMKDKNGKIIYVGKSKALKNRVSQYFQEGTEHNLKTARMVSQVRSFSYMLTDTEMEALSLENRLIKLHTPKFNIKLKDAKTYPYIKVTVKEEYPRISVVRKRLADGAAYFGPYSGTAPAYAIVNTVQKAFRIPSCTKQFPRDIGKSRPCLNCQMGLCMGVCTGSISKEEYRETVSEVISFLRGSFSEVKKSLQEKMEFASEHLMFETAALYRDRIRALSRLWQRQKVVASPDVEQDVFALYSDALCSCLTVFYVRGGCISDSEHFLFPGEQIADSEAVTAFLCELYLKREYIPHEILLGFPLHDEDRDMLEAYLRKKAGRKINLRFPERGTLHALCDMVADNAKQYAAQYRYETEHDNKTLIKLASLLALEVVPERIEAFDISNYGSEHITAGKVSMQNGKFNKSAYRLYKIETEKGQDDYASMRQAVERRLRHTEDPYPDLLLLDGGKGHVSVIRSLLSEMGIDLPVFGMVKDEYHKTRALTGDSEEISIAREQSVFSLVYRLQEEVHRYTVSHMSAAKRKTLKTSVLEEIDGIGRAKAQKLLASFRSIGAVRRATEAELCSVRGISARDAAAIRQYFADSEHKDKST